MNEPDSNGGRGLSRPQRVALISFLLALAGAAVVFETWPIPRTFAHWVAASIHAGFDAAVANKFWFLALLPGTLSLFFWWLSERHTFDRCAENAARYLSFKRQYDAYRHRQSAFQPVSALTGRARVRGREFTFGAVAVTLPFFIVASLSNATGSEPLGMNIDVTAADHRDGESAATAAPPATPQPRPATLGAQPSGSADAPATGSSPKADDAKGSAAADGNPRVLDLGAGIRGLVFAGYGAYFYLLLLLLHRINATALSPKFLVTSSLRASTSLVLGFLSGLGGLFTWLNSNTQQLVVYTLIGAFPLWAASAIQRKARELLQRPAPGTEPVPIDLVDGIDDFIAERLSELGITDIQHLATADVAELSLRTLYSFERVIDWVDQAILITYLRQHIIEARALGIRGAIDMRGTYKLATDEHASHEPPPSIVAVDAKLKLDGRPTNDGKSKPFDEKQNAKDLLADLATKAGLPAHVVYGIGGALASDYEVTFLRDLWHHRCAVSRTLETAVDEVLRSDAIRVNLKTICAGSDDAKLQESEQVLKSTLQAKLNQIHPIWGGHVADLKGQDDMEEIKRTILANVTYYPD